MSYVVSDFYKRPAVYGPRGESRLMPGWGIQPSAAGPAMIGVGAFGSLASDACSKLPSLQSAAAFAHLAVTNASAGGFFTPPQALVDADNYAQAAVADAQALCAQSTGTVQPSTTPVAAPLSCAGLSTIGGLSAADVQSWCQNFTAAGLSAALSVAGAQYVAQAFNDGASDADISAWATNYITARKAEAGTAASMLSTLQRKQMVMGPLRTTPTANQNRQQQQVMQCPTDSSLVNGTCVPDQAAAGPGPGGIPGWVLPVVGFAVLAGGFYYFNK